MIDIHTHVLPNADNGCKDYNDAGRIILEAIKQGVTHMILTPHEKTLAGYSSKELTEKFNNFKKAFEKRDIELFLGAEIEYSDDIFLKVKNNLLLRMNNTNVILLDFLNTQEKYNMKEVVKRFKEYNIKVIIAHIECYKDITFTDIEDLKNLGAYIQVDAETILDKRYDKWLKTMYKERYIDFIASNIHSSNISYVMKNAFMEVSKKASSDYADLIFNRNPKNLLITK